jgi:hypothetical protein
VQGVKKACLYGLDTTGSGKSIMVSSCEHCNELVSSIKRGETLEQLSDYHIFKKTVTWN